MAQWVNHLLCKCEDLSSNPQSPGKVVWSGMCLQTQYTLWEMGRGDRNIPRGSWACSPGIRMSEQQETLFLTRSPRLSSDPHAEAPCCGSAVPTLTPHSHRQHAPIIKLKKKITNLLILGCVLKYFILFCYSNLCVSFFCLHYHPCNFMNISENIGVVQKRESINISSDLVLKALEQSPRMQLSLDTHKKCTVCSASERKDTSDKTN